MSRIKGIPNELREGFPQHVIGLGAGDLHSSGGSPFMSNVPMEIPIPKLAGATGEVVAGADSVQWLLNYQFSTSPAPLQVSTPAADTPGLVNVRVSPPPGQTIYCNRFTVGVPIGLADTDLGPQMPSLTPNTTAWVVSGKKVATGAELGLDAATAFTIFYVDPTSSDAWKIGSDLVFSLAIPAVNRTPGTFGYVVVENSGTTSTSLVSRRITFPLEKALPSFYLANVVAVPAGASQNTQPSGIYTNGQAFRLEWESNGTWFQVIQGQQVIYSGPNTSFTLANGVARSTSFVLVASVEGGPPSGTPNPGFQSIFLYEPITVTITNPDLTPRSVVAANNVNAATLAATGQASAGSLVVTGAGALNGGASVQGGLRVTGGATADSASLGQLVVSGSTQLNNGLAVSGTVGVGGGVNVTGTAGVGYLRSGSGAFNGYITITNGGIWATQGNSNAGNYTNASSQYPTIYAKNTTARSNHWATGIYANVAGGSDWGLYTNGRIGTSNKTAAFTHIETRAGHRVVTSPLSLEVEIHLSGTGRLSGGRATVVLDPDVQDMIAAAGGYRVQLTPAGQCLGLCTTRKR
ncbi:MAG TPA: hypothetical protein VF705_03900, partial [Longimicrobium sp.]